METMEERYDKFAELMNEYKGSVIRWDESGRLDYLSKMEQAEINKEIIIALDYMANSYSFKEQEVLSRLTDKGKDNLTYLAEQWVQYWASDEGKDRTDLRNEKSTEICGVLAPCIENGNKEERKLFPFIYEEIRPMHRTLVQTSSRLMFNHLKESNDKVAQKLEEIYGYKKEDRIGLPMI